MISLYTIFTIVVIHWIVDFYFQTDKMAKGKSHDNEQLSLHVTVYTVGLLIMALCNMKYLDYNIMLMLGFAAFNSIAHFFTDYVTSRATSLLYKEGKIHDFFVTVGADQLIHYVTLFGSFYYATTL